MNIKRNIILFGIALCLTLGIWVLPQNLSAQTNLPRLLISSYNTNPNRLDIIAKYCKGKTKTSLISNDQLSTSQGYKKQLAAQFTLSGNDFINTAMKDTSKAQTQIQKDIVPFALFTGFFILGLFFLMTSWCFLLCCCCCPSCCPSKCCQKNQNQQYTKCELYWPSIVLILSLLLIVAAGAIGFSKASSFSDGIGDLTCAASIMFDDIVNGNVTLDNKSYFIGIQNLITTTNTLGTKFGEIQGNITDLTGTAMTSTLSSITTAKGSAQLVPSNSAGGAANIQYTIPFDTTYASSKSKINSQLNSALGDTTSKSGIIGNLYDTIGKIETSLSDIKSLATTFSGIGGFNASAMTSGLGDLKKTMTDLGTQLGSGLSILDTPKQMGTMIFQIIYGVAMGFAVFALIGVVFMTFCDKYKCRYLMYFSCLILFFFAIVGFMLSFIFSLIIPIMYWGCDWLSVSISTGAGFSNNVGNLIGSGTTNKIKPCLADGNGDLITQVAPSVASTMNTLRDTVSKTAGYNVTDKVNSINSALTNITEKIDSIFNGKTPDISDTSSLAILIDVAKSSNYNTSTCTSLAGDSWAVSNDANSYGKCQLPSTTTNVSGTSGCLATTDVQTAGGTAGCRGCLDSTSIFNTHYSAIAQGDWKLKLNARYTAATCVASFNEHFGNVWDNYYFFKIPEVNAIKGRWGTTKTDMNNIVNNLTTLSTTMDSVITKLKAAADSVTDPDYGLIAGLNCKVIGQDINLLVNSICISNFNTIYITRIALGMIAFGILISMCCIVCSGVRHFKHSQRKDKISPSFDNNVKKDTFQDTDAAFKP